MNTFEKQIQKLSVLLLCLLSACHSGPMVNYTRLSSVPSEQGESMKWQRVSDDPYLLKRQSDYGTYDLFLTSIEECGKSRKDLSASVGRQLFVGFKNLRVRLQQMYPLKEVTILRSIATAEVETKPLLLVSYTLLDRECSRDIVLWLPNQVTLTSNVQHDIEAFEKNLNQLFDVG